jgi:hypothetical protein
MKGLKGAEAEVGYQEVISGKMFPQRGNPAEDPDSRSFQDPPVRRFPGGSPFVPVVESAKDRGQIRNPGSGFPCFPGFPQESQGKGNRELPGILGAETDENPQGPVPGFRGKGRPPVFRQGQQGGKKIIGSPSAGETRQEVQGKIAMAAEGAPFIDGDNGRQFRQFFKQPPGSPEVVQHNPIPGMLPESPPLSEDPAGVKYIVAARIRPGILRQREVDPDLPA